MAIGLTLTALLASCGDDDPEVADGSTATSEAAEASGSPLGAKDAAEGEAVKIGFVADGQNAAADQSIELDIAAGSVRYINEHRGGLGGRPIELVTCETRLDPAKASDCGNEMVQSDVAAVLFGTTGLAEAIWKPIHEAGIPTIMHSPGAGSFNDDRENTFTMGDPSAALVNTPAGVAKDKGKEKVTAIVIDVPAAVSSYSGAGLAKWEQTGIDVDLIRVPPGTPDLISLLGDLASDDPGVVHVVGNDSFCIGAFKAMIALDVDAPISAVAFCVTDETRKVMPGAFLEGMTLAAVAPIGDEGPQTELIRAVADTYGAKWDLSTGNPYGIFQSFMALWTGTQDLEGEVTPQAVIDAIKAAPEQELPGSGGLKFRCNGKATPDLPAVCMRGTLVTVLDDTGHPGEYKVVGGTPIPD